MIEIGLITKLTSKEDARQAQLFLTQKGIDLNKKIAQTFKNLEEEFTSTLDIEEQKVLRELLDKIYNNLLKKENI